MEKKLLQIVPRNYLDKYTRSNYRVVGKHKHTSLKPCHWLEQKLQTGRLNRNCYKGYWGIKSEKCIQNSPAFPFCNHNCAFCWREPNGNLDTKFTVVHDTPEYLIDELIRQQKNLVEYTYSLDKFINNYSIMTEIIKVYWKNLSKSNPINSLRFSANEINIEFSKQVPRGQLSRAILLLKNTSVLKTNDQEKYNLTDQAFNTLVQSGGDIHTLLDEYVTNEDDIKKVHESAMNPSHAAISLDGEPTLYPLIGEFIDGFRKKDFTTFVVTNGTTPDVISGLNESGCLPSILYVTIPPPDKKSYSMVHRPRVKDTYEKIRQTMEMVKDLKTRTVFRITSVKNLNIKDEMISGYAELINEMQPDFLDIKGFTLEGSSMQISNRLGSDQPGSYYVPDFGYLMNFAQNICDKGGFELAETHEKSRDILIRVKWPKNKSLIITPKQR